MNAADYRRVEEAIRYLEANFTRQPSLEEVADHVGLSKFYFQRIFRRWAGVSPKRFLQYLTIEYAKDLLRRSESVLETSYETGLSGSSRLHDLFVAVEAVTPGEFKSRGTGLEIGYGTHPSPFGNCLLAATERGVCSLSFFDDGGRNAAIEELESRWSSAALREESAVTESLTSQIFAPEPRSDPSPLRLFLRGTNFQLKVWQALLRIPQGALTSYGAIAASIGHPGASRAVGTAVGYNPVAFLIPCHRVIRSVGTFGEYRWGRTRKVAMLGWEAARSEIRMRAAAR